MMGAAAFFIRDLRNLIKLSADLIRGRSQSLATACATLFVILRCILIRPSVLRVKDSTLDPWVRSFSNSAASLTLRESKRSCLRRRSRLERASGIGGVTPSKGPTI